MAPPNNSRLDHFTTGPIAGTNGETDVMGDGSGGVNGMICCVTFIKLPSVEFQKGIRQISKPFNMLYSFTYLPTLGLGRP